MDYYIAIVWPFFHEEHFRVEDRTLKMCAISAMGKMAMQAKFGLIEIITDDILYCSCKDKAYFCLQTGSIGVITGFYMNGVLDCREEQCPSLVTMAMSKNGNLSLVVLVAIVTLWVFMLATSLHVFCIAIKTTRKNAVAPASQGQEKQDEQQVQETAKKLYAGIKSKMAKVKTKLLIKRA